MTRKSELQSWLLLAVIFGVPILATCFLFGVKGLLVFCLILGILIALISVIFLIRLLIDKDLRKSFIDYFMMDDE